MDTMWRYMMENPLLTAIAVMAILIIIWFFKKFLKLVFILIAIFIAVAAYNFFITSGTLHDKTKAAVEKPKKKMEEMVAKGKGFFEEQKKNMKIKVDDVLKGSEKDSKKDENSLPEKKGENGKKQKPNNGL
jgi:hypothetical protein